MTPWTDRADRFSPLKAAFFLGCFLPGLWLAYMLWQDALGPKPITVAIHETGDWAVRFLLLSLAVTPFRHILDWTKLIQVRRMLGVTVLAYAAIHLTLYVVDQKYDLGKVASEIVLRFYLTIGFVALLALIALGATSTDAAVKRLKRNWTRLHMLVYPIGVLAVLHFFLQSKLDVTEPTVMGGLFLLLMLYRVLHARRIRLTPLAAALAALAGGLITAALEFAWYGIATGVDPWLILAANLDFSFVVAPAWWVLGIGLAVAAAAFARRLLPSRKRARAAA
ncbi:MAG: sulfite oxidase heme-binding subunit YedZ [Alphaproteobacteria bacterium]